MMLTTHTAIGATIGFSLGNPILGFLLGLLSHLLVDMIPHGDSDLLEEHYNNPSNKLPITRLTLDAIFALLLILLVVNLPGYTSLLALSATLAGSIFPDLLNGIYELTRSNLLGKFHKVHFFFHDFFVKKYGDIKLLYGFLGESVLITLLLVRLI